MGSRGYLAWLLQRPVASRSHTAQGLLAIRNYMTISLTDPDLPNTRPARWFAATAEPWGSWH